MLLHHFQQHKHGHQSHNFIPKCRATHKVHISEDIDAFIQVQELQCKGRDKARAGQYFRQGPSSAGMTRLTHQPEQVRCGMEAKEKQRNKVGLLCWSWSGAGGEHSPHKPAPNGPA